MEDCSPERLVAEQLIASMAGPNVNERNRPLLERTAPYNRLAGTVQEIMLRYRVKQPLMEDLMGLVWDVMQMIACARAEAVANGFLMKSSKFNQMAGAIQFVMKKRGIPGPVMDLLWGDSWDVMQWLSENQMDSEEM